MYVLYACIAESANAVLNVCLILHAHLSILLMHGKFIVVYIVCRTNFDPPQEELKKEFKTSYLPVTLAKLEKRAAENNSPEGWIFGTKVNTINHLHARSIMCIIRTVISNLSSLPAWLVYIPV